MLPDFNNNGPCYELFSSATDIVKYWKFKGKINKEFESHSKSNYYFLQFGGVSAISIPINEKYSLQIANTALVFQFSLVNKKSFTIEISIKDTNNFKKRLNFTTSVKDIEINSLNAKIPMGNYPLNIWSTLLIDVASLTSQCFKNQKLKFIDSIRITGCMKIRKIYSIKNKDEPIMKNIEMGKSIPVVNLLISNINDLIISNTNLQIIGNNISNLNLTSNSNNASTSMNSKSNHTKNYTPYEIMRKNMYYKKKDPSPDKIKKNNMNKEKDLSDALIISPLTEYQNKNNENSLSKKTKDNLRFAKRMPNISNVKNDIKYGVEKNKNNKNVNINKIMGFNALEEEEIVENQYNNNISKKDRGKSIGRATMPNKFKEPKKRNKSNNPFRHEKYPNNKLKKEKSFENDSFSNNDLVRINESNNSFKNNNNAINKNSNNNSNKEIIIEDFNEKNDEEVNNKKELKNEQIKQTSSLGFPVSNDKFKFNNIALTNSIMKKLGEENVQNNKYNYDVLDDPTFEFKNIPIYDNIEDVTDWNAIENNNNINNTEVAKMGEKIIKLESSVIRRENKNNKNNNNNEKDIYNVTGKDFLEISTLINQNKDSERPYTPPIGKLVPVDPNKLKESKLMNSILKMSTNSNRILKNYENLIYDPTKGFYYDPKTNIYYDIKSPSE